MQCAPTKCKKCGNLQYYTVKNKTAILHCSKCEDGNILDFPFSKKKIRVLIGVDMVAKNDRTVYHTRQGVIE